jgi:hypothetical protein
VNLRRRIAAVAAIARESASLNRPVSAPFLARMLRSVMEADVNG